MKAVWSRLAFIWIALAFPAHGHEIRPAVMTLNVEQGRYTVNVSLNIEALLVGVSPEHRDTDESPNAGDYAQLRALVPAALKQRWLKFEGDYLAGVTIEADGQRVPLRVEAVDIPAVGDIKLARISRLRLAVEVPPTARALRFAYAPAFGSSVWRVPGAGGRLEALWLRDGRAGDPYVIGVGVRVATRAEVVARYTGLGFTHILPYGLDHILFVLGLFLLSVRWRPLLIQVTAFTVAHTITLALSVYGVLSLAPAIVEPLIAASIVYVAVENLATARLHAWRPVVVFGFGLLHGLGFAGVLEEIGLPRAEFLTGLLSFNVGVELGQLAVIAIAYLLVGHWFRHRPWYRARVVVPASALIAAVGGYWTMERLFG